MAKINTLNYQTVASWNGSQDLFVVEQPNGTKVATPAMVKQFIEAGDFTATGEVKDGHGNILKDMASRVSAFTSGAPIDISSYSTSSNRYTCPSDGYLRFVVNGGGSGWVMVNNQSTISSTGSSSGNTVALCMSVKKGMTVYLSGGNNVMLYFIPLS